MPRTTFSVDINGEVLRWAREEAGRGVEETAQRINASPQEVTAWETGRRSPSWQRIRKLAAYYKRSEATLLLPEPPARETLPPDFRRATGQARELSPRVRLAIRTARWLQSRAIEIQELSGTVGSFEQPNRLPAEPEPLAKQMRSEIGIDVRRQQDWKTDRQAFAEWRAALERKRILIFQFPIPAKELLGFSLFDSRLPVIVVSQSDPFVRRRIFTLFHEFGHLLIGKPGLCIPDESIGAVEGKVESFCNRFAATFLVPETACQALVEARSSSGVDPDESDLRSLANKFLVSKYVVLGRMRSTGGIGDVAYRRLFKKWQSKDAADVRPRKSGGGGGMTAPQICIARRGRSFVSLVVNARKQGIITTQDALAYLDVKKLKDLRTLESADT
jgi:Zn-dependent peptidase ImmA (M78 family)/DNA-binding XRE family transcriptional regulator